MTDGSYQTQYTGSPVEPEVALTYDGQKISTTDYTVSYGADHTSRGTVTLTATAKDGYGLYRIEKHNLYDHTCKYWQWRIYTGKRL